MKNITMNKELKKLRHIYLLLIALPNALLAWGVIITAATDPLPGTARDWTTVGVAAGLTGSISALATALYRRSISIISKMKENNSESA